MSDAPSATETATEPPERSLKGYVYAFHSPASGLTKLGFSRYPGGRFADIKTACPDLQYLRDIATDDPRWLERCMHTVYAHRREHGEWFRLDADDHASIMALPEWVCDSDDFPAPMQLRWLVNTQVADVDNDGWVQAKVLGRFAMLERLIAFMAGPDRTDALVEPILVAEARRLAEQADPEIRATVMEALAHLDRPPFSPAAID